MLTLEGFILKFNDIYKLVEEKENFADYICVNSS